MPSFTGTDRSGAATRFGPRKKFIPRGSFWPADYLCKHLRWPAFCTRCAARTKKGAGK